MTENELLSELSSLLSIPEIAPNEVTAQMLAAEVGISPRNAKEQLKRMAAEGSLSQRTVKLPSGHHCIAYRKIID